MMDAGAPVVFLLAWLVFLASIGVIAAVVAATLGGHQLLLSYVATAGSISLVNTLCGYFVGQALKAPPLGQVVLASVVCIPLLAVWLFWAVLLFLGTGIILLFAVVGWGTSSASHCVYSVSGWQQAHIAAQWAKSRADDAGDCVEAFWQ